MTMVLPVSAMCGNLRKNLGGSHRKQFASELEACLGGGIRGAGDFIGKDARSVETGDQSFDRDTIAAQSGLSRNRYLATSTKRSKQSALGRYGNASRRMIEDVKNIARRRIVGAANDPEGPLAHSGDHDVVSEDLRNLMFVPETLQTGGRQNDSIKLAGAEFTQPGIDVAAKCDEFQSRESMPQLDLAAKTAGSDAGASREFMKHRSIGDERIARIFTFGNGGEVHAVGKLKRDVLQAVYGQIDATVEERFVDFFREQTL